MEQPEHRPTSQEMRFQGQHEKKATDTSALAAELARPTDSMRIISDFDDGLTPLRDVGRMLTAQRSAILEAYEQGNIKELAITHPEILEIPVKNLHERLTSGDKDQPIGHNFFVNATGFLQAGLPWAKQLDELLQARTGSSIYDIARSTDQQGKDQLLAAMTGNPDPELLTSLAVYLAGRSLAGELYLEQNYGETLQTTKRQVESTLRDIGSTTGLSANMIERAVGQLHRVSFGSLDHLSGLVTSDNTGAAGDYIIGTLRIEVQFEGNVQSARLRDMDQAHHIIAHELHHASSVQSDLRCGLQSNGRGLSANEGMTEYLAQIATGESGIEKFADGSRVKQGVPYRSPVFAILALHEQFKAGQNNYFAILFNAYHGDVRDPLQLEKALDEFYRIETSVSKQL